MLTTLNLSDVTTIAPSNLLRDATFSDLGLLNGEGEDLLAHLYDARFAATAQENPALSAVITTEELAAEIPGHLGLITCHDPSAFFYALHDWLQQEHQFYQPGTPSRIDASANVHPRAFVAETDVVIGPNVLIEPGAVLYPGVTIEQNVIIRANATIGGEGFEPKHVAGKHIIVPHYGGVVLEADVEVQCGTHIARSVFRRPTRIGRGTKVDALVHIAHNVTIGADCEIVSGVVIGGSSVLGDRVWVGPNATVSSLMRVGDDASVSLGAVAVRPVPEGARVSGNFAIDHKIFRRQWLKASKGQ